MQLKMNVFLIRCQHRPQWFSQIYEPYSSSIRAVALPTTFAFAAELINDVQLTVLDGCRWQLWHLNFAIDYHHRFNTSYHTTSGKVLAVVIVISLCFTFSPIFSHTCSNHHHLRISRTHPHEVATRSTTIMAFLVGSSTIFPRRIDCTNFAMTVTIKQSCLTLTDARNLVFLIPQGSKFNTSSSKNTPPH